MEGSLFLYVRKHSGVNAVVKGEESIGIYERQPSFSKLKVNSYIARVEGDTGDWGSGGLIELRFGQCCGERIILCVERILSLVRRPGPWLFGAYQLAV